MTPSAAGDRDDDSPGDRGRPRAWRRRIRPLRARQQRIRPSAPPRGPRTQGAVRPPRGAVRAGGGEDAVAAGKASHSLFHGNLTALDGKSGRQLTPSVAIPVDSDASPGKNAQETAVSPLVNGEKSIFRDQVSKDRDRPSLFLSPPKIQNQALLSGLAYCISSCSMILVNKYILSGYGFSAGIFLMLYQNIVSVTIVSVLSISGVIPTEPLTWKLIKVWLPVNFIFVGMLITSMFSLKYINVAMLTILKNVANVITASGETYFFKKQHDRQVWISLTLMLTLRHVMDSAKQATKSGNLNELSMVLLNNILSVPLGIILVLGFNEVEYLLETPLLRMPMFWIIITASGVLGLAISFTSMWFLHQTSATTYSLVGSLNKIPLSIAGILLFEVRTSMENSFSILFGRAFFITNIKVLYYE
uniref:Sugar phosphate transporter domain-containing protein n=1 Tax=Leersia perrieri TaxID=77586 RepID=A0A0D9X3K4_9ORYZ